MAKDSRRHPGKIYLLFDFFFLFVIFKEFLLCFLFLFGVFIFYFCNTTIKKSKKDLRNYKPRTTMARLKM